MITLDIIISDKQYTVKHNNAALIEYQKLILQREKDGDPVEVTAEHAIYLFWSGFVVNNDYPGDFKSFQDEVNNSDELTKNIYDYYYLIAAKAKALEEKECVEEKKQTRWRLIGKRSKKKP